MTKHEQSLLDCLEKLVRSAKISSFIQPTIGRVRAELERQPGAQMTWKSIPLEIFDDQLPASIRSAWVFVLRKGANTGAERHPNSHQRMLTYAGKGDMQLDVKTARNDVENEDEIRWRSNMLVSDPAGPVKSRWISIPPNVWHRPVIPKGEDWVVVSFHTVAPSELIEERPGSKQMRYEPKIGQNNQPGI